MEPALSSNVNRSVSVFGYAEVIPAIKIVVTLDWALWAITVIAVNNIIALIFIYSLVIDVLVGYLNGVSATLFSEA